MGRDYSRSSNIVITAQPHVTLVTSRSLEDGVRCFGKRNHSEHIGTFVDGGNSEQRRRSPVVRVLATKLVLRPDRQGIAADGQDVSVIAVEVVDAKGRPVPTASNDVTFKITGPGRLIGLGNGDPSCHEPDKPASPIEGKRSAFNGLCMAFVQAFKQAGEIRVAASGAGLVDSAAVVIRSEAPKVQAPNRLIATSAATLQIRQSCPQFFAEVT